MTTCIHPSYINIYRNNDICTISRIATPQHPYHVLGMHMFYSRVDLRFSGACDTNWLGNMVHPRFTYVMTSVYHGKLAG